AIDHNRVEAVFLQPAIAEGYLALVNPLKACRPVMILHRRQLSEQDLETDHGGSSRTRWTGHGVFNGLRVDDGIESPEHRKQSPHIWRHLGGPKLFCQAEDPGLGFNTVPNRL